MKAIVLLFLTCMCSYAQDKGVVTIVDDSIVDGVENKREKVPWHNNLTLGEAMTFGKYNDFTWLMYVLSNDTAVMYTGHEINTERVKSIALMPGDILVLGVVSEERSHQLDQIPEVHQRLGNVNWLDYKKWVHYHPPLLQLASPLPSTAH